MATPVVPYLNVGETSSVCSDIDSGIGSCSPTSTGPAYIPEHKSVQTFRSTEDYLYAMREDLAEWLNCLYDQDINVDNFFDKLDNGVLLCDHANHVQMLAEEYRDDDSSASDYMDDKIVPRKDLSKKCKIPEKGPLYRRNVKRQTFQARDNIANFISWCKALGIPDVILFETEDLVMRKNDKSVVLALLEVARRGARFGMLVPCLIQLEQEIDAEIKGEPPPVPVVLPRKLKDAEDESPPQPMVQKITCDMKSLDEMVRELVSRCTCLPQQFPVIRLAEGKYMVGEQKTLIFVRILRNHVMVRVGGGWDTLEHYLNKHDPCRCSAKSSSRKSSISSQSSTRVTPTRQTTADARGAVSSSRDHTGFGTTASPRSSVDFTHRDSSCPSTPTQSRRSAAMREPATPSPAMIRRASHGSSDNINNNTTTTSTAVHHREPSAGNDAQTAPTVRRKLTLDNIPRRPSVEKRSPTTPERQSSLALELEGSLTAIRQQSELLQKQLQDDFSDDSLSTPGSEKGSLAAKVAITKPMARSLDLSRLRDERRGSSPAPSIGVRKDSVSTTNLARPRRESIAGTTISTPRRAQTPSVRRTENHQEPAQRMAVTPQPVTSRTRSQPTTPIMRRRADGGAATTNETERNRSEPSRYTQSRTKTSSVMTTSLKDRLIKYKQETQSVGRTRRNSDTPNNQSNLVGSRQKSPSLSALDRRDLEVDLDAIVDSGGDEALYQEMEKMFQEFKVQERAKLEQEVAKASVEAELERRLKAVTDCAGDARPKQESARETLRERLRMRSASTTPTMQRKASSGSGRSTSNQRRPSLSGAETPQVSSRCSTAPTTPTTPRRAVSATPSWRDNDSSIVHRSSRSSSATRRCKTPEPKSQLSLVPVDEPDFSLTNGVMSSTDDESVKMCRCCSKLSECLLDVKPEAKPRRDDDFKRRPTRIPGPKSGLSKSSDFHRTTSLISLTSSTDCESMFGEEADLIPDNEVKTITKTAEFSSLRNRRMSAPEGNPISHHMAPLVTNRSTIMKNAPRPVSPMKAVRF